MSQHSQRRLGARIAAWMAAFVVVFVAVSRGVTAFHPPPGLTALLLLLPLLPLAGALWAALQHHRHGADELEQRVELQSVTLAAGLLLIGGTFWGFLVRFLGWPAFPLDFSLPVAIVVWAVTRLAVSRSYG